MAAKADIWWIGSGMLEQGSKSRIAFVTVGQSPRDDVLPEILSSLHSRAEYAEIGALDGLGDEEIQALAPANGERRLCTRLRDGRQVITSKNKTAERLNTIFAKLEQQDFDIIVLLCTGYFENVHCGGIFVESQRLVDNFVSALAFGGATVGVMVPLAEQMKEDSAPVAYERAQTACASPYSGHRFREAGQELSGTDMIVMHCMGYSQAMRQEVMEASGKPVILARRVVAAGIDQLI